MRPRRMAVKLLIGALVAWQKKKDERHVPKVDLCSSSIIPQSNIILPLPGSPFFQSSRL